MKFIVSVVLTLALLLQSVPAFSDNQQDTVYLKNGSIIKGIIEENIINDKIRLRMPDGNIVVFRYNDIEKIEHIIDQGSTSNSTVSNSAEANNSYYQRGVILAQDEYTCHTGIGGFFSGLTLGLIGWGVGYVIIANKHVKVPSKHTSGLGKDEKHMLSVGYQERASSIRKSKFHVGAAIGLISMMVIMVESY